MSTTIQYNYPGLIATANIPDIIVTTDKQSVWVTVETATETLFADERYFADSDGKVTLADLAPLFEQFMRSHNLVTEQFSITVYSGYDDDHTTVYALYCDRLLAPFAPENFLAENFLTSCSMRRIAPGDDCFAFAFFIAEEAVSYSVAYTYRDLADPERLGYDTMLFRMGQSADTAGVRQVGIAYNELCDTAAYENRVQPQDFILLSVTITCGNRSISFFYDQALKDAQRFTFRNCFNCFESVRVPGVMTTESDVERSIASLGARSAFYDAKQKPSFELQSAALTSDEALFIDQLLCSDSVVWHHNSYEVPILITDISCEVDDLPEGPNTVKFSWLPADNRLLLNSDRESKEIFTDNFNPTFD